MKFHVRLVSVLLGVISMALCIGCGGGGGTPDRQPTQTETTAQSQSAESQSPDETTAGTGNSTDRSDSPGLRRHEQVDPATAEGFRVYAYGSAGEPSQELTDSLELGVEGNDDSELTVRSSLERAGRIFLKVEFDSGRYAYRGGSFRGALTDADQAISIVFHPDAGTAGAAFALKPNAEKKELELNGALARFRFGPGPDSVKRASQVDQQEPLVVINPDDPATPQNGVDLQAGTVEAELHLVGDANADAAVDFSDIVAIIDNFGLSSGGDGAVPALDPSGDGTVEFSDITAVINRFGVSVSDVRMFTGFGPEIRRSEVDPASPRTSFTVSELLNQHNWSEGPRGWLTGTVPIPADLEGGELALSLLGTTQSSPGQPLSSSVDIQDDFLRSIPPPADLPVNDQLPAVQLDRAEGDDYSPDQGELGGTGIPASRVRLMLRFKDSTTVGEANQVLSVINGVVVGTLVSITAPSDLVFLRIEDTGNLQAMSDALGTLNDSGLLELPAVQDVLLTPFSISTPSVTEEEVDDFLDNPSGQDPSPWSWTLPPSVGPGISGVDGNWGMEAVRAPMLWNLRTHALRQDTHPKTGILDVGFATGVSSSPRNIQEGELASKLLQYEYSQFDEEFIFDAVNDSHGQHVAGIIGGGFYEVEETSFYDGPLNLRNKHGVQGINPLVEQHGTDSTDPDSGVPDGHFIGVSITDPSEPIPPIGEKARSFSTLINDFYWMVRKWDFDVVNLSLGYNWGLRGVNSNTNTAAQRTARRHGLIVRGLFNQDPGTLFVAAAGNDSNEGFSEEIDAEFASPFAWARLGPDIGNLLPPSPNAVVVESTDGSVVSGTDPFPTWHYTKSDFSNVGAVVSAPGERILSSVARPPNGYGLKGGTSMAAPHVTGLAGFMRYFAPDIPPQDLQAVISDTETTTEVRSYAEESPMPDGVGGPARMIDAFAAVMDLDRYHGNKKIQRGLVDVDDGTRDGNLRQTLFSGDPEPAGVHTSDGRRGDGRITMRDFRVYRDAYLQATDDASASPPVPIALDGSTTHFKKDLNMNGCRDSSDQKLSPDYPAPYEVPTDNACEEGPGTEIYPRYDFNGDGRVFNAESGFGTAWQQAAPFKSDPDNICSPVSSTQAELFPGCLRDLDVLAGLGPATGPMGVDDSGPLWQLEEVDGYNEGVYVAASSPADCGVWNCRSLFESAGSQLPALNQLPDLMHSFDLHLSIDWSALPSQLDRMRIGLYREAPKAVSDTCQPSQGQTPEKLGTFPRDYVPDPFLVTVPVRSDRDVTLCWRAFASDQGANPMGDKVELIELSLGEDRGQVLPTT